MIWRLLYQRDLSEQYILKIEDNLMDKYIEAIQNRKNLNLEQLLYFAAENGYEILLKKTPVSSLSASNFPRILELAVYHRHLNIVKYLIDVIPQVKNSHFYNWYEYCFELAAENGNLDIVEYLIEKGIDLHSHEELPLRLSVENGHLKMAYYLIEKGADIKVALHISRLYGNTTVINLLTKINEPSLVEIKSP